MPKGWTDTVLSYGRNIGTFRGDCPQQYEGLVVYQSMDDLRRLSRDPQFKRIRELRDQSTTRYVLMILDDTGIQEPL